MDLTPEQIEALDLSVQPEGRCRVRLRDGVSVEQAADDIMTLFRGSGRTWTPSDLEAELRLDVDVVLSALSLLYAEGRIRPAEPPETPEARERREGFEAIMERVNAKFGDALQRLAE